MTDPTGQIHHLHWKDLAQLVRDTVGQVDALIVDAPYSERTHGGQRHGRRPEQRNSDGEWVSARGLGYESWSQNDVYEFVGSWGPLVRGWVVSITDHRLAPAWETALARDERYVFAPIPIVQIGMNVRLAGDGPSSWTCWAVVARPKCLPYCKWGTLPGAYVGNPFEEGENHLTASRKRLVVGGKPFWLMDRLVEDYTRDGDLVCDPCCGAGTTLLAAKLLGRRYIGGDIDEKHAELARERLRDLPAAPRKGTLALPWGE